MAEWPSDWERANAPPDVRALPSPVYAYLLGMYLGDGHIAAWRKGLFHLRIYCDTAYPGIVLEVKQALRAVRPAGSITLVRRAPGTCTVVQSAWRDWPVVFPQHGPGRKHERAITLEDWQLAHTRACPEALVRGLMHSDGCRFIARQRCRGKTYAYERYAFKNESADIRAILTDHLRLLGVHWTYSSSNQIDINRRADVARLDEFVGPKY